jgi:hypothetical protein
MQIITNTKNKAPKKYNICKNNKKEASKYILIKKELLN